MALGYFLTTPPFPLNRDPRCKTKATCMDNKKSTLEKQKQPLAISLAAATVNTPSTHNSSPEIGVSQPSPVK